MVNKIELQATLHKETSEIISLIDETINRLGRAIDRGALPSHTNTDAEILKKYLEETKLGFIEIRDKVYKQGITPHDVNTQKMTLDRMKQTFLTDIKHPDYNVLDEYTGRIRGVLGKSAAIPSHGPITPPPQEVKITGQAALDELIKLDKPITECKKSVQNLLNEINKGIRKGEKIDATLLNNLRRQAELLQQADSNLTRLTETVADLKNKVLTQTELTALNTLKTEIDATLKGADDLLTTNRKQLLNFGERAYADAAKNIKIVGEYSKNFGKWALKWGSIVGVGIGIGYAGMEGYKYVKTGFREQNKAEELLKKIDDTNQARKQQLLEQKKKLTQ